MTLTVSPTLAAYHRASTCAIAAYELLPKPGYCLAGDGKHPPVIDKRKLGLGEEQFKTKLRGLCDKLLGCIGFDYGEGRPNALLKFVDVESARSAFETMTKEEGDALYVTQCQRNCQITHTGDGDTGECWVKKVNSP